MKKISALQFPQLHHFLFRSEIQRLLLTSVVFGFLLVLARTVHTGSPDFFFLVWNLFLAFVPYLLSYTISIRPAWVKSRWKFIALFTVWLLFVPNSFYMLTDLFHLYDSYAAPRWYDLTLIFCFAWNALLMGILSVRHMEKITKATWNYRSDWFFVCPVMLMNAFGIYIGRYLRYNTWDVISNPFHLLSDTGHILLHPVEYKNAWGMVLVFSGLLSILYMTLRKLSKSH